MLKYIDELGIERTIAEVTDTSSFATIETLESVNNELTAAVRRISNLGKHVGTFDTFAVLPYNVSAFLPLVPTVNDWISIRQDENNQNATTRYIIENIEPDGTITWSFDIVFVTDITGKMDIVPSANEGQIAIFDDNGQVTGANNDVLISSDSNNRLTIGSDGGLVSPIIPITDAVTPGIIRVQAGNGLNLGAGANSDRLEMNTVVADGNAGAMTGADKARLDGMEDGATANTAGDDTPLMNGTASPGDAGEFSRSNHVHPVDTGRAPAIVNTFTYVIDSNDALEAWANNDPGNDYSRVLIKSGTWTITRNLSGGTEAAPLAFLDISGGRTRTIIGESNSLISFVSTGATGDWVCGINSDSPSGIDYFFERVSVEISGDTNHAAFRMCSNFISCYGSGIGNFNNSGFRNCDNLTHCVAYSVGTVSNSGFRDCTNINNCTATTVNSGTGNNSAFRDCQYISRCNATATGTASNTGFRDCSNITNSVASCDGTTTNSGFRDCTGLVNCLGQATGPGTSGTGNFGFRDCRTGFGNRNGSTPSTTGTFSNCFMEQVTGSTAWANTAAGGYNLP